MKVLDAEAKRNHSRREYESQGIGKSESIRQKRLAEPKHGACYDIDEYENSLDKERFGEQCFRLRGGYPNTDFMQINFGSTMEA